MKTVIPKIPATGRTRIMSTVIFAPLVYDTISAALSSPKKRNEMRVFFGSKRSRRTRDPAKRQIRSLFKSFSSEYVEPARENLPSRIPDGRV